MGRELHEMRGEMRNLVRVNEQQTAILDKVASTTRAIEAHDKRISVLERDMPPLVETRKWVIGAAVAAFTALGSALLPKMIAQANDRMAPPPQSTHRPVLLDAEKRVPTEPR
jgi:hypothetical protein